MISGTLGVTIGFDDYVLGPGDAISFDSMTPHRMHNLGKEPVHGIWFQLGRRGVDIGGSAVTVPERSSDRSPRTARTARSLRFGPWAGRSNPSAQACMVAVDLISRSRPTGAQPSDAEGRFRTVAAYTDARRRSRPTGAQPSDAEGRFRTVAAYTDARRRSRPAGRAAFRRRGSLSNRGVQYRRQTSLSAGRRAVFRRGGSLSNRGRPIPMPDVRLLADRRAAFRRGGSLSNRGGLYRRQTSLSADRRGPAISHA